MRKRHAIPSFTAALILSGFAAYATATSGDPGLASHIPRDGDRLHPGVSYSRSAITTSSEETGTARFDPDSFAAGDNTDIGIHISNDTISHVQFATKHLFRLHADTLSYLGFENRATLFSPSSPILTADLSLPEGDMPASEWTGCAGLYGQTAFRMLKGRSESETTKGWTIAGGNDTIRGATRLVWQLDMAYIDTDSIMPGMPDSVAAAKVSDMIVDVDRLMSERLLTRRVMWFSEDARYPVLQQTEVSRILIHDEKADTVPASYLAMYYPASFQLSDTGEEPPRKSASNDSHDNGYGERGDPDSSITAGEPSADEESVSLTLSSSWGETEATVTLYSDSGIRLSEPFSVPLSSVPRTIRIPSPSGWKGVLLIRIETEYGSLTRKTLI